MSRGLQLALLAAAFLFAGGALGQAKPRWEKFADGNLEVLVPDRYEARRVEDGALNAWRGADKVAFRLQLQPQDVRYTDARSGEKRVQENATFLKLPVRRYGNKVVLLEPPTRGKSDQRDVRGINVQIGFGRSLVLMSITVFEEAKTSSEAEQFFETDMDPIVRSIRAVPGRPKPKA